MAETDMSYDDTIDISSEHEMGLEMTIIDSAGSEEAGETAIKEDDISVQATCRSNSDCRSYAQIHCGTPSIGFCEPIGQGYGICDCFAL